MDNGFSIALGYMYDNRDGHSNQDPGADVLSGADLEIYRRTLSDVSAGIRRHFPTGFSVTAGMSTNGFEPVGAISVASPYGKRFEVTISADRLANLDTGTAADVDELTVNLTAYLLWKLLSHDDRADFSVAL